MVNIRNFYGSGFGNRLINPLNYPEEIVGYLSAEHRFLMEKIENFQVLIEVGCMQGRCLEQVVEVNKSYIGIDIVEEYIEAAILRANALSIDAKKYDFLCLDAANLHNVLALTKLDKFKSKEALIFFPFNSFGNIENVNNVLSSLKKSGINFFISTYKTDKITNMLRMEYYQRCNYRNVLEINESNGKRFISDEGLSTIAYLENWIISKFDDENIEVQVVDLDLIGVGYLSVSNLDL